MRKYFLFIITILFIVSCSNPEKEYHKAQTENTIQGYENFLKKYPQSEFNESAKENIMTIEFAVADSINTIDAYNKFIQKYPESEFSKKAASRITEMNNQLLRERLKENTGWEIRKVWNIKTIEYSIRTSPSAKKEGVMKAKSQHSLIAIELYQFKKKDLDLKSRDIKIIDDSLHNYYPIGLAPFSLDRFVPLDILEDGNMLLQYETDAAATIIKRKNYAEYNMQSPRIKFYLFYYIPVELELIKVKILNFDPITVTIENIEPKTTQ